MGYDPTEIERELSSIRTGGALLASDAARRLYGYTHRRTPWNLSAPRAPDMAGSPSHRSRVGRMTDDRTVIFLHIGKTAGSTLRQVLKRQFPSSQALTVRARRRPRTDTIADFARLPEEDRLRPRLIMGHTVFGLHEGVPRPCTYVTMLRQPVKLALSQYRYVQRIPSHHHHEAVKDMTLEEYVASRISFEMDNSQTRAIAGDLDTPVGECTPRCSSAPSGTSTSTSRGWA